jgi:Bax protein
MPPSFATAWAVVEPEPEPLRAVDPAPDFRKYVAGPARKAEFLSFLRPLIAAENRRVLSQRRRLEHIATKTELTDADQAWLTEIAADYKLESKEATEPTLVSTLLQRVDIVPVSLALAQAAKESAWGTSRFAVEGNNFFGEWCFRPGCGIVPLLRAEDLEHEVEAFSSASASIGSYLRNLNTHESYESFRMAREALRESGRQLSGILLADELTGYSERREDYVEEVKHLIRVNRLADVPIRPDAQHSVDAGG